MIEKLVQKAKCKFYGIEIVDISERAIGKYRCKVKDNSKESIDTCIHKLIRNYNVGKKFFEDEYIRKVAYGNLTIVYDKQQERIINVYNHYGQERNPIDEERKALVDKVLGIK